VAIVRAATLAAAVVSSGCGSIGADAGRAPAASRAASGAVVDRELHRATLRFAAGRAALRFGLREPPGVILLYRITAPAGIGVRGSAQLPGVTVPLLIATRRAGLSSSCSQRNRRVVCTVGEEWCPMPAGTWRFRVEKLGGAPATVGVTFRVARPPASGT
jgi:hypothetical protein